MYTEVIKLIEGGLSGDKEKVYNYALLLATNLEKEGESGLAKKIRATLNNKKGKLATLDSFSTTPVDTESRMDIVDIYYPVVNKSDLILNRYLEEELNQFVEGYKRRDDILNAGLNISNSLLLYGPPGCGKTTVAQYVSSILGIPLVTARLDGLVSSLLGSTSKNIRKIFDYVNKRECILFLDEFDVVAKLRDDKNELGELKRVVNSLIQNIDNLNPNNIIIAATNHHELLDPAIWRRFSKIITLQKPEKDEIERLLSSYISKSKIPVVITEKKLSQVENALIDCSHADIKTIFDNIIREAILGDKKEINICLFLKAIYVFKNHSITDEDEFIRFLLNNNVTHKEINENIGIPLRKIQAVSKNKES